MFRVGSLLVIVFFVSLFLGCEEKTSEASPTGLAIAFQNCITFNATVLIDNSYIGQFTSERSSFIEVPVGSHTFYAEANLVVDLGDTTFCWTRNFSIAEGQTTVLNLDCRTGGCPERE